jgi:hypothetical protein
MTLALFVLGDMSEQALPLRIYTTEDAAAEYEANYLSAAALKSYAGTIDEHVSQITGLASTLVPTIPTIDPLPTPDKFHISTSEHGRGAWSGRMDDTPSKSAYRDLPSRQSQSRTLKRSRSGDILQSDFSVSADENSPRTSKLRGGSMGGKLGGDLHKAAKNARLLKALRDVEWTMREMGSDYGSGSADGDGMEVDEVEATVV